MFHLQKSDVSAVLEYVRHSVTQKKVTLSVTTITALNKLWPRLNQFEYTHFCFFQVHLSYEVRDKGGVNVRHIPVDKEMTELTLSLSGDKDDEDFLDIQLKDPKGFFYYVLLAEEFEKIFQN